MILGHLRSIATVFVNYAVKANAECEDSLLLPCIEALMQVIRIVASHFNAKKEDFFKVLDLENSDTRLQWIFYAYRHLKINAF